MRFPITEKLIQRQINHWSRLRELLHDEPVAAEVERGPIVTISRLAGAGGRTLATGLPRDLAVSSPRTRRFMSLASH